MSVSGVLHEGLLLITLALLICIGTWSVPLLLLKTGRFQSDEAVGGGRRILSVGAAPLPALAS
jgi:hypothetical protein